jgi:ubiquinone/menaquinone biosynthesis C-methylase UbiE
MQAGLNQQTTPRETASNLWQSFWREAGLHGCTTAFPQFAQTALKTRWSDYFSKIDGTSVLDIATGRGAVLAYANAVLGEVPGLSLTGVDLVQAPARGSKMNMLGGVDAASLPFPDRGFDHVTSQFGIEYAGFEPALDEAARVCARTMLLLVHASEGVITTQNQLQAAQSDWVLTELRLPAELAGHFAKPTEASAERLNHLLRRISERARVDENTSLLEGVYASALEIQDHAGSASPQSVQQAVAELAEQLSQHRDRMALLSRAGITRERIEAAADRLKKCGFQSAEVSDARAGSKGQLLGYWLEAARDDIRETN